MRKKTGLICVSIGCAAVDEALAAARQVAASADVIEIRLDTLKEPAVLPFIKGLAEPLLFTHRPGWEGGFYEGGEEERLALLGSAVAAGAAFVDLELLAPADSLAAMRAAVRGTSSRLIISNHNFVMTPSRAELLGVLEKMKAQGAHIGKIVTTAHDFRDVLRVLRLQEDAAELELPLIAFCMGRAGVISRLATLELGGFMTYCAAGSNGATAPGQIPVQAMRQTLQTLFPA